MGERRFSDKEMSAIIQRATELQIEGGAGENAGATLTQIQQAASELGIAPELVERAARDLASRPPKRGFSFFGVPVRHEFTLTADKTLAEADWPWFLEEVRRASGRIGEAKPVGNSFQWVSRGRTGIHLSITPRNGQSTIGIRTTTDEFALTAVVLPVFMTIILSFATMGLAGVAVGLTALVLTPLIGWTVGRWYLRRATERHMADLQALAESLQATIEKQPQAAASTIEQAEPLRQRLTSQ